ncbi:MAG TPA: alpha/beta hydrolase, partial [Pilimelia sp.]|nr:alpha/beta hydrolase [Pilimelia sp.]
WAALEAIAPTLGYDDQVLAGGGVPRHLASKVAVPVLVLAGSASPESLQQAAKATAEAFPTARYGALAGQTHDVAPDALAPVLIEFFGA